MGIQEESKDLKRLLELFPSGELRQQWPDIKGTKDELCFAVAGANNRQQIVEFVNDRFSCCKQHVYVVSTTSDWTFPSEINGVASELKKGDTALFILRVTYEVVLRKPVEETTMDFLWPIKVERINEGKQFLLRLIVMEKTMSQYFDRAYYVAGRSVDEEGVLREVSKFAGPPVDLHKGIRTLWDAEFMDSSRAKIKKALSMAFEAMDEERGIREHNPELYGQIGDSVLINALFALSDPEKHGVSVFSAKPTDGFLSFQRYSKKGGPDFVVSEILRNNK